MAARLESLGVPMCINISKESVEFAALSPASNPCLTAREQVVKGRGPCTTYLFDPAKHSVDSLFDEKYNEVELGG